MKNNKLLKHISLVIAFIFIFSIFVYADSSTVVTLGKDLNTNQRKQILDIFGVNEEEITIIEVNNQEERAYLEGVATEAQLGKITMSSAYVELLEEGSGIEVETYNISWVTREMYQSALVTAGVKDARVIAAAPFPVSGTGALTGIIKAFEQATGERISEEQKKVANEEIVQTGKLGEEIGKEKATELIRVVKEEVIEKRLKNPEEIKKVVVDIAARLDINLHMDQIEEIAGLMKKINSLNLDTKEIREQLKGISEKIDQTLKDNEEVKSLLQKIIDMINDLFKSLFGMLWDK